MAAAGGARARALSPPRAGSRSRAGTLAAIAAAEGAAEAEVAEAAAAEAARGGPENAWKDHLEL